jgi:predicted DNA-binding transcriptional regulator
MDIQEVKSKIEVAKLKLEEIKSLRSQYQDALKGLDLNEAGWLGYIEALTPYSVEKVEDTEVVKVSTASKSKKQ